MKGIILQSEGLLSIFFAFLAFTFLVISVVKADANLTNEAIGQDKELQAHQISESFAKFYVDENGNIDADALQHFSKPNARIVVAGRAYGRFPPENSSVYHVRRLVFANNSLSILEVYVW